MQSPIRILHLEDNDNDALLVRKHLETAGIQCEITVVTTRPDFVRSLETHRYDLIFSDFSLPSMDGLTALQIARVKAPDTPFVFISGTIGEETAVDSLTHGAKDYILKHRMEKLGPAIRRVLDESRLREEQKKNDRKIREQADLLDKAQDAIIVIDLERHITFWNKGAERVYEWKASEVIGRQLEECFPSEKKAVLDDMQARTLKDGEWMGEWRSSTKGGKEVIAQSRWSLITDERGTPQSILVINTDITANKKLESLFLRAQRLENLGTLAGGIAHDLNNILGPILLAVQIIGKKLNDPDSRRLLETIERSAKRGADMVRQILSFARGSGEEPGPLGVKHLIQEVVRMIEDTFPPNITIRSQVASDLWSVIGDATQIHQVLINLCVNARDSMPQGGTLTILAKNAVVDDHFAGLHEGKAGGRYVEVTVSDTGIGMSPAIRERIFEPFFSTKGPGKGTGLGLSTALGIVKNHGGFFDVKSTEGKGTSFSFFLPASETVAEEKKAEAGHVIAGHGETILVIDDEDPILEITKATLEGNGFKVLTAADGTDGVALFAQHKDEVKAVIVDMVMPYMDGPSTIRAIQKLRPDTRFIAVSGMEEYGRIVARQGASLSFLQKPYTMDRLLEVMSRVLSQA